MVFSSLTFLYIFLPVILLCHTLARGVLAKNLILTVFSLFFYAWGEPVYVFLMLGTSLLNYVAGLLIDRYRGSGWGRLILALVVAADLGSLGVFKYAGFLVENLNSVLGLSLAVPEIALPIGISFYTFQILSYVIDLYWGKVEAQRSFLKLLMYICLFPQLIAGPIVRYSAVAENLDRRQISVELFGQGVRRFCGGLAKKVILANSCGAAIVTLLAAGDQLSVLSYWAAMLFFTFQIYFDFSGYSDMAIGLGRMLGFQFKENFNYPYVSRSATEFWRRWHISLGSFFRDYLYIPLGGNRRHQYRNLLIVWFLTGLWHGASWNFVLWGLGYGVLIAIEKLFLTRWLEGLPRLAGVPLSYAYMAFITVLLWTVFYFTDTAALLQALSAMFGGGELPLSNFYTMDIIKENLVLLAAAFVFSFPWAKNLGRRLFSGEGAPLAAVWPYVATLLVAAALVVCTILLVGSTYNPFLYFRF